MYSFHADLQVCCTISYMTARTVGGERLQGEICSTVLPSDLLLSRFDNFYCILFDISRYIYTLY